MSWHNKKTNFFFLDNIQKIIDLEVVVVATRKTK